LEWDTDIACIDQTFRASRTWFLLQKKVIFVHGCFWHGHECKLGRLPKTRIDFWQEKITSNRKRDILQQNRLRQMGWKSLILWECQLKDTEVVKKLILEFLG